jgi:hypothetical protein
MTRYLTKICDQLVCLLSSEHSQAIVWGDEVDDLANTSLVSKNDYQARLFSFEVAKTHEQEENVIVRQGFTVRYLIIHVSPVLTSIVVRCKLSSSILVSQPLPPKVHIDPDMLSPRLLYGEKTQGFMTAHFRPVRTTGEHFSRDRQSASQIRLLL